MCSWRRERLIAGFTTQANQRIWQDVYRPSTCFGRVYLKLTVIDDVLIVSFKEL
ncbi:type II toxin-antitoxin system MqsR family toxin [Pseudomonas sp. SBB6]|uniref:type II toxin-antitoxin system MqsR family toxin n=1 Tax=Pseudomonas sp. SBB6 TaxID=2962032 RepID=UPI00349F42B7